MRKNSLSKKAIGVRKTRKPTQARVASSAKSKNLRRSQVGFGSQAAALFAECGLDEPIQEFRGYFVEPMEFEL